MVYKMTQKGVSTSWMSSQTTWVFLLVTTVLGYGFFYAPFGVNETDGGFLTGLAWQILQGKILYQDIVYVRPPLPVWLRSWELQCLPETWAILGERWIFYLKLALYSSVGAAILAPANRRWMLATLGFVVSAHCYPAMAWHTVDGILMATLAAYGATRQSVKYGALGGIFLLLALLCKQSFYPLLPIFGLFMCVEKPFNGPKWLGFWGAFAGASGLFLGYLYQQNTLTAFFQMTSGASSGGQAIQHGLLDYARITPELALPSLCLLLPVGLFLARGKYEPWARYAWYIWLIALPLSYAALAGWRQVHTVPFAQSRAFFWVAALFFGWQWWKNTAYKPHALRGLLLLGIAWSASVSWGYNLPILFATPWIWAGMEISLRLEPPGKVRFLEKNGSFLLFLLLILSFRVGFEFVYRDGRRSAMNAEMGAVFPALSGIYSTSESASLYRDFWNLQEKYGTNFTVLPAFPQANFLTKTTAVLPLDWVVNRETNGDNQAVLAAFTAQKPIFFVQKSVLTKLKEDPELSACRQMIAAGQLLEESPFFQVYQPLIPVKNAQ